MTLRKRGVEPQDGHRRLDGHITPEDPPESAEEGDASELPWATGDGCPASPAAPAGDREG